MKQDVQNKIRGVLEKYDCKHKYEITSEMLPILEEKSYHQGAKDFAESLIDQLKNGTIVDQYNPDTDVLEDEADTKLVSDVLHTTAVEIVEMHLEDFLC